jgi:hypothetical protein
MTDRIDVREGQDTDLDGVPDTLLMSTAPDLLLAVDTDRDSLADVILEVGVDRAIRRYPLIPGATDPLSDACYADDLDFDDSEW